MRMMFGVLLGIAASSVVSLPSMAQTPSAIEQGHEVFAKWCAGCHSPEPALEKNGHSLVGSVFAGTYTLEQRYKGTKPAALEQRTDLNATLIKYTVRHGLNVMPRSRKTEISDTDLDAIVDYLTQHRR
jgi:mono/diheme cytochrome c family protein